MSMAYVRHNDDRAVSSGPTASSAEPRAADRARPPALETFLPTQAELDPSMRAQLLAAGKELRECRRVLTKAGLNVVGEVLRGQGDFVEFKHYPNDDVFDTDTHAQYYYHAHRGAPEHGHFHTFLRAGGMPHGVAPLPWPHASEPWPAGTEALSHLVAVSMDAWGEPIGLFTTNRWVTGETWYPAGAVICMLDRFKIDHAWPSWPTNRWLGALLRLYRPWIEALIRHRDAVIAAAIATRPDSDVFEDRALEITGYLPVSPDTLIEALERAA